MSGCSEGIYRGDERMASINPRATHMFKYRLNVYMKKGKRHFCARMGIFYILLEKKAKFFHYYVSFRFFVVQLFDSRRKLQDTANVTFKTYTPCVCLHNCICKVVISAFFIEFFAIILHLKHV